MHLSLMMIVKPLRNLSEMVGAGVVQQGIGSEQLVLLVDALTSDAVRSVDQQPAQQQLLAVILNTITLAGRYIFLLSKLTTCTQAVCQAIALLFLVSSTKRHKHQNACALYIMRHYKCGVLVLPVSALGMDAGSKCGSVSQQLWLLLLQLQAIDSSPALASQAAAASERLAAACALSSSADLAATHAPALIRDVTQVSADPQ